MKRIITLIAFLCALHHNTVLPAVKNQNLTANSSIAALVLNKTASTAYSLLKKTTSTAQSLSISATKHVLNKSTPLLLCALKQLNNDLLPLANIVAIVLNQTLSTGNKAFSAQELANLTMTFCVPLLESSLALHPAYLLLMKPLIQSVITELILQYQAQETGSSPSLASALSLGLKKTLYGGIALAINNITGILAAKQALDTVITAGNTHTGYWQGAKSILSSMAAAQGIAHDHAATLGGALERYTTATMATVPVYEQFSQNYADAIAPLVTGYHNGSAALQDQVAGSWVHNLFLKTAGPIYGTIAQGAANITGIMAIGANKNFYGFASSCADAFATKSIKNATVGNNAHDAHLHGALERIVTADACHQQVVSLAQSVKNMVPEQLGSLINPERIAQTARYAHSISASVAEGQGLLGAAGSLVGTSITNTLTTAGSCAQWLWRAS